LAQVVERIEQIHADSEAAYFFDLDSVPTEVMLKLMTNSQMEKVSPKSIHKYMADQGEPYEATDYVSSRDQPRRKFLFGRSLGNEMFFVYFHGGRGNHLHLVHADLSDTLSISSFVTLNNWETLSTLNYEYRISVVKEAALKTPLVRAGDMKALRSKVYEEFDLF